MQLGVLFWGYSPPKQLDWCLCGCIICKLPQDAVAPVAFFSFFWGDIGCKGLYLSTPAGQNPHHFNLHAFVLPLSLAPANGSRFGISRMRKHSFNGQKSLIWIMDPYHSHLQPQKLHEAGGTGRLPDTGGSSR